MSPTGSGLQINSNFDAGNIEVPKNPLSIIIMY